MKFLTALAFLCAPFLAHAAADKTPIVFVSPAKAVELFDSYNYPARAVSKLKTTVLYEADGLGVVAKIHAPLGTRVKKNEKLLTIRHTDPVYQYAPVVIRAPIAGVVAQLEVTEGAQVTQGAKLMTVTDPKSLRLLIEAPAPDLAVLEAGMKGEFRVAGRAEPVAIRIVGISPAVDPTTGTASCELEVDPTAKAPFNVAPGLLGQVSFKANTRQGFTIPDHALVYKGSETFIRLVENGKARRVAVKLGRRQRGNVEVLEGLTDGAALIERTSDYVSDGQEVKIEEPQDTKKDEAK